ncbi:uncharacterized protein LOC119072429 [Bradysia coprophila]|uniref:uncharacterized protein LOC119072429 n=1 Tax=Bradysia coprophila TaxID=38358 RepID=UPI00187DA07D|nr:uncharacterized protein LOC119072429 [Bradysia coprophila]
MSIKYFIAVGLLIGVVTTSKVTCETTCEPSTTTCGLLITTPKPTCTTTTPKPTTKPPPCWKAGVDEHVGKCKAALKFFVGPTYKTAKSILDAFLCLIPKLESSTKTRSLIISSKAVEILETISIMTEVGNSPSGVLNGFKSVLHIVLDNYRTIVSSLDTDIGISTSAVTDAITDLEASLYQIIADYENASLLQIGGDENIDYKQVLCSVQKLTNAVAYTAEAALKNCENDANVGDSIYILMLIFEHLVIIAHATNVSIAAELNVRCGDISNSGRQGLKVIDNLLNGITKTLNAVVNTVFEAIVSVVEAIVDLAQTLNAVLKSVFGLVENVTKNLTKTVTSSLTGVTSILKIGK